MASNEPTDHQGYRQLRRLEKTKASIVHGPSQVRRHEQTFGSLLRLQARARPTAPFVYSNHQNKSLTYGEADTRTDYLARGLARMGVNKGDRVAIMAGNDIEYIEVFFACTKIGALCVLANYAYTESELHAVLASIGVSVLVMVPAFDRYDYKQWLPRLRTGIPSLKHLILWGHDHPQPSELALDYEQVVSSGCSSKLRLDLVERTLNPRDVTNLQFTSGSTGMPKASALTHRGLLHCSRHIGEIMYLQSSDKICLPVPLFHSFGIVIGVAVALVVGASVVLCDRVFNPEATLQSVARYQCTGIYGVTTMFITEMNHPAFKLYNLSSLRFAMLCGSAVPEHLMRKVWAAFGLTQTHTNWGMTEASSIVTMTRDTDTMRQRTLTSGCLFAGFSGKIVDPATNRAVSRGVHGEIVLRGPGVQACYFGNKQKTTESHIISPEDGLEWFHTGDQGLIDDDGFFVITGRIKDIIIRGGENISPTEIEARLAAHPAVAESAVVGVPDERYGEQICAFVEARPGASIPLDNEIATWIRQTLAHFKAPKYVIWLGSHSKFSSWPMTGSGKLKKPELKAIAAELLRRPDGLVSESPMRMARL